MKCTQGSADAEKGHQGDLLSDTTRVENKKRSRKEHLAISLY